MGSVQSNGFPQCMLITQQLVLTVKLLSLLYIKFIRLSNIYLVRSGKS